MKSATTPKGRFRLLALASILSIGLVLCTGAAQATATSTVIPPGLLLWNKLGSADEVTHSEYGPNLVFFDCVHFACGSDVPGTLGYPAGVFGGAASITGGPYFPGARVHAAMLREPILNPEHGAVEAWYRQTTDPVPFVHNPHRIFGGPYSYTGIDEVNLFSQDRLDNGDPRLHFSLFFDVEPPRFVPPHLVAVHSLVDGVEGYRISALNGQWIHVAGVWDRNGIAGTQDTIRLYVNDRVVATSQDASWGTTTCDRRLAGTDRCNLDVAGCNDTCADTFAVDNLKVWDYAKTDFSDRFTEGFGAPIGGVVAWGCGSGQDFGQCDVPTAAESGVTAIAAGFFHSLALKEDGSVIAWGCGRGTDSGQCSVPAAAASGVTAVAAGLEHSLALKQDGSVVAWGCGSSAAGQCDVPAAAASGVTAIAAGLGHSLALKQDGSVIEWGCPYNVGECTVPAAATSGVTAIAAGAYHNLALKDDGSVIAWGCGGSGFDFGQCAVPAAAASGVTAIAAANLHSLALKQDGGVIAWGCAGGGDLGQCAVPPAATSGVTAIAAGLYQSLALKQNGSIIAWGCRAGLNADFGQCAVPASAASGVIAVAGGAFHSLAVVGPRPRADLSLTKSHSPDAVQVGDTLTYEFKVANAGPQEAVNVQLHDMPPPGLTFAGFGTVTGGGSCSTTVSLASRAFDCSWPSVASGTSVRAQILLTVSQPGRFVNTATVSSSSDDPDTTNNSSTATVQANVPQAPGVVVAWGCAGSADFAQCGMPSGLTGVRAVAAASFHSLALKLDGTVVAWGCGIRRFLPPPPPGVQNNRGQCSVPNDLSGVTAIAAASAHSLALKSDGTVVAWGCGIDLGQCSVPSDLSGVVAIAAGASHSLALKRDGTVVAWGCGPPGLPLGGPNQGQCSVPSNLTGVTAIAAGAVHSLALKRDGTVVAWGCAGVGPGSTDSGQCSVPSDLTGVTAIAAGARHSLALKRDGTVVAWGCGGSTDFGQCGVPSELTGVTAIAAGNVHSLALIRDGTLVAWGCGGTSDRGECSVPSGLPAATASAAGGAHSLAVVGVTAMFLKQDVLAQANALLTGATKADADKLKDVVKKLTDSLDASLWVDGNHLIPKKGAMVFDKDEDAVTTLMDLVKKSSIPTATLQGMIDKLEQADQLLATTSLKDAIAASGDPKKIAGAQNELTLADQELAKGHFVAAIDHYKNAWQQAQQALS